MAGVAAAQRLAEQGISDFLILEAQDRLGGRMRTEQLVPGVNVNVGANWIHGVDRQDPTRHPIYELAIECGIQGSFSNFEDIVIYDENGTEVSDSALRYIAFETALESALELAGDLASDNSRTALTQSGWTPENANDNYVEWFSFDFSTINPPDVTSLEAFASPGTDTDFLANPSNPPMDWLITDNRGTAYLAECLANSFTNDNPSADERIHLEAVVTRVEYGDDCVCATVMENGQSRRYCADYAIVTFSIGVLKNQSMSLFDPPLPSAKTDALNLLTNGFYYLIFAAFENRFWDENEFIGHIAAERGYLPVISVIPESRGANATSLPVTGDTAFRLAGMTDEQLRTEVGTIFRNIYGNNATDPTAIVSMRWGLDPFFMGSYSNVKPGGFGGMAVLARPEGNMHLAGEGTSSRYNGYIHGAYFSGREAAEAINRRRSAAANVAGNAFLVLTIAMCKILYMYF